MKNMEHFAQELIQLNIEFLKKKGIDNISIALGIVDREYQMTHVFNHEIGVHQSLEIMGNLLKCCLKNPFCDNDAICRFLDWAVMECEQFFLMNSHERPSANEAIH